MSNRSTIPPDGRCIACRCLVHSQHLSRRPGARPYAGKGRCEACSRRVRDRARQPPGSPRARIVPRAVLVEEVLLLRSYGEPNERIASRLGMKPLSFERALHRAGIPVDRARMGVAA